MAARPAFGPFLLFSIVAACEVQRAFGMPQRVLLESIDSGSTGTVRVTWATAGESPGEMLRFGGAAAAISQATPAESRQACGGHWLHHAAMPAPAASFFQVGSLGRGWSSIHAVAESRPAPFAEIGVAREETMGDVGLAFGRMRHSALRFGVVLRGTPASIDGSANGASRAPPSRRASDEEPDRNDLPLGLAVTADRGQTQDSCWLLPPTGGESEDIGWCQAATFLGPSALALMISGRLLRRVAARGGEGLTAARPCRRSNFGTSLPSSAAAWRASALGGLALAALRPDAPCDRWRGYVHTPCARCPVAIADSTLCRADRPTEDHLAWLDRNLAHANSPSQRDARPWVVVLDTTSASQADGADLMIRAEALLREHRVDMRIALGDALTCEWAPHLTSQPRYVLKSRDRSLRCRPHCPRTPEDSRTSASRSPVHILLPTNTVS